MNKYIHAENIEEGAMEQFNDCMSQDFVIEGALMPDTHQGYVAPIGSVLRTKDAVVPAWVGYDIGCGMIAILVSEDENIQSSIKENAKAIFDQVNRDVPMGAGVFNQREEDIQVTTMENIEAEKAILHSKVGSDELLKHVMKITNRNLGTLGSGNHFIEILTHENETWLVIHSGSRGVGHFIGTHFMKSASGKEKGFEETHVLVGEEVIRYMAYQEYCLRFALLNRLDMAKRVANAVEKITGYTFDVDKCLWTNKNHNHCVLESDGTYIHRKGATTSNKGERGVIPANMRDGCFLVIGKGNPKFLNSSSHGAGRSMSRGKARKEITMEDFKEQMVGITAPVVQKVIDESPNAYKNIKEVMEMQKESIDILKHLKPIINWKGF